MSPREGNLAGKSVSNNYIRVYYTLEMILPSFFMFTELGGGTTTKARMETRFNYQTYFSVTVDPFHTLGALRMFFLKKWSAAPEFNVLV